MLLAVWIFAIVADYDLLPLVITFVPRGHESSLKEPFVLVRRVRIKVSCSLLLDVGQNWSTCLFYRLEVIFREMIGVFVLT